MGAAAKSVIKRNIATNVLGGGWSILLNLIAIPVEIRILGAEAYGLIGFIASLQGVLTVFDFGIPTTLIREVARDASPDHRASHDLIRTSATVYWVVAGLVALALFVGADWISQHWLIVEALTPGYVAGGLRLMALLILFVWPLNVYVGTLSGLQRFDVVNLLRIISITASELGGILLLLILHDLYAFLILQVCTAFLNLVAHAWVTHRLLTGLSLRPGFSRSEVRRVWSFSLDMNIISTLAIVYTQTDRLLIGALLPLRYLGYYNAAYNITTGLALVQGFFSSAILPALAKDHAEGNNALLRQRYYKFAQLLIYLIALPAFIFMFFGREILSIWTTAETAVNAYGTMALLALGSLLNLLASAPYILALATGHSRIPLRVNIYGLLIYLPVLYFLTIHGGIEGAALTWVLLNLYYLVLMVPWVQRRVLNETSVEFLLRNFVPFMALGILFWLARQIVGAQPDPKSLQVWIVLAVTSLLYSGVGFLFLDRSIRQTAFGIVTRTYKTFLKGKLLFR